MSDIVGLGATFLSVGVVLAGGAVAFALATCTPPTESEFEAAEQPRSLKEHPADQLD
ncbi:hypothetical protein [Natrinema sp. SYSU A 869]|uniref:hypothetical protein n=1 Tax=Natrinema sp. SYSU A 869 TaxID=2871694 RepID=UPI001CA3E83C|nr:hypothetical protein [Natrinema sp. SYSU A 869]